MGTSDTASAIDSDDIRQRCAEAWDMHRANPTKAIELAASALGIARRNNDIYAIARCLHTTGLAMYLLSQLADAIGHLQQALPLYKKLGDDENTVMVMRQMGGVYLDMSAQDEALPFLLQALTLAEHTGNETEQTACLLNIAKAYGMQGDIERALEIYHEAEALALRTGDLFNAGIIYRNLGVNTCRLHRYADAIQYLRKALSLHHRIGNRGLTAATLEALGSVFAQSDNPRKALRYYATALRIQRAAGLEFQAAVTLSNIGATLDHLGDSSAALEKTLEGLALAEHVGAKEFALEMHRQCADLYEKSGDHAAANHHLHRALDFTNELSETRKQQAVSMYQVRFDVERSKVRQQDLLRRLREAEHTALRSQMNPHFISNALSAIQSLVIEGESDEAQRYLSLFARLIRKLFEQTRSSFIPLEDELDTLRLYLQMEKLRYESRFEFAITIIQPLDIARLYVPPLILQPLAENALLHGILPSDRNGVLAITAQTGDDNSIRCTVTDNGLGLRAAAAQPKRYMTHSSSLGLTVVRERLALLQESTGRKAELFLEDRSDTEGTAGTTAAVVLPALFAGDVEGEQ